MAIFGTSRGLRSETPSPLLPYRKREFPVPAIAMADDEFLPDANALTAIRDLTAACLWAKVQGGPEDPRTLLGAFLKAAGGQPTLVPLARLPRTAIEALANNLRVELTPVEGEAAGAGDGSGGAATPTAPTRAVSLLEVSSLVALHDVCVAATGRGTASAGTGPAPVAGEGTALAVSRKIKLSSVVDVTAEADIASMAQANIAEAFRRYRDVRGECPHPDHEPTPDQLSAVAQLLASGAPPTRCRFCVWPARAPAYP